MSKFLPELKVDDDGNYIAMFLDAEVDEVEGKVFDYFIELNTKNLEYIHIDHNMIHEMIEMMQKVEKIYKKKYDTKRIY
tara:strand:- start:180 stop:416 length:237 start_codon:yes stop_codon:yes gene_type:complete